MQISLFQRVDVLQILTLDVAGLLVIGDYVAGVSVMFWGHFWTTVEPEAYFIAVIPHHSCKMADYSTIWSSCGPVVVGYLAIPALTGFSALDGDGGVAPLPVEVLTVETLVGGGWVSPLLMLVEMLGVVLGFLVELGVEG